ncbi:ComF family protein [Cupriavidus pauculus]|uniref:ComF family protein n=1 Tax=Cupriavidus pauculus TaxID=82633 RepID=A0A2N5CIW8_9BURK|nr:ComF family protein [Cupriavidus pauculus]PLQ02176.1 ComF family protein [Cupriavidus pauculus]
MRARRVFAGHAAHLWRALLPSACLVCATLQRDAVCTACADVLQRPTARCPRCATPGSHGYCGRCADEDPLDATLTLGDYAAPFDKLVLQLKFGARLPAAGWIATGLAMVARTRLTPGDVPDLLVPIPLSPSRLAERGFNQAWEIARPLARHLGVRASATLLSRQRDTVSQRTLDLAARLANPRHAFAVGNDALPHGLHIGLIDDVMTTGATLREAARVLKAHGAGRVTALDALRTP